MSEIGGFPCSIDGLRLLATDEAIRTPSSQGKGRTAKGRLVARMPNSQEEHRVTRRVPNSHEGIHESANWLRMCPEG